MNQEQILIIAEARRRKAQQEAAREQERLSQPPPTMDVVTQAPVEALASTADVMLNAPQNVYNLGKALYGTAAGALGAPASALPEATVAPNRVTDYLKEQGLIQEMPNMTPQQRVLSSALQGATGALVPGGGMRQLATDVLTAGVGAGAGQAVTEATGNPLLGLATSVAAPVAGSRVPALNAPRAEAQAMRQEIDRTINEAKEIGFLVMPEGAASKFAGQDVLIDRIEQANQKNLNKIARESLGVKPDYQLIPDNLKSYRKEQYDQGYKPFKAMGNYEYDQQYIDEIYEARRLAGSNWEERPDVDKLISAQLPFSSFEGASVVDRIKELRSRADLNFKAEGENKEFKRSLAPVQKAAADALENLMVRELKRRMANLPNGAARAEKILERFQNARKNIAVSYVIEDAVEVGSGNVMMNKLASAIQRGDYITGDLAKAAKFGNVYKPVTQKKSKIPLEYRNTLALGGAAAAALGLNAAFGAPIAAGSLLAAGAATIPLRKATEAYLLSRKLPFGIEGGQYSAGTPDYTAMGINPRMALPASVGMFSNLPSEEEQQ